MNTGASLEVPQRAQRALLTIAAVCAAIFVAGLVLEPRRAWGGLLQGFIWITGLALAGGVFLACLQLSGARWATALRRLPAAMFGALPWAAGLGLLLLLGIPSLYAWAQHGAVEHSALIAAKTGWMNPPLFALRLVLFFLLWWWTGRRLLRSLQEQAPREKRIRDAALFMAVFGITFSLASVDWLQSLEAEWFSTIYTLVVASGIVTSGLAVVMVAATALERTGPLQGILTRDHLDDIGKIAMGFSLFWIYIWFCQYMLIWYTNMPEETSFYVLRSGPGWSTLVPVNLILNFLVPFLVLMPKRARRSYTIVFRVGLVMLFGHALDLYLLVAPPLLAPGGPALGPFELAPIVGALCLFTSTFLRRLTETSLLPTEDPTLAHSLGYHC